MQLFRRGFPGAMATSSVLTAPQAFLSIRFQIQCLHDLAFFVSTTSARVLMSMVYMCIHIYMPCHVSLVILASLFKSSNAPAHDSFALFHRFAHSAWTHVLSQVVAWPIRFPVYSFFMSPRHACPCVHDSPLSANDR